MNKSKFFVPFVSAFLIASAPWVAAQVTLVVDAGGNGDFEDIQSALDEAADGDTVLVAPGVYVIDEPLDFNRLHDPLDPDSPAIKNCTLQSELGAVQTTIRLSAQPADPSRDFAIVFENSESNASVLEGFSLSASGCVVRCDLSSPTIVDCKLLNGSCGIRCEQSSPRVRFCEISGNTGGVFGLGGGVYSSGTLANPTFEDCILSGNSVTKNGGGIYSRLGSPIFKDCTIVGNTASGSGGGMWSGDGKPVLSNCVFDRNTASTGAGVACGGSPRFESCTFSGNRAQNPVAASRGGGVFCGGVSPRFIDCTFSGNSADHGGAAYCTSAATTRFENCTMTRNAGRGAVYCAFGSRPTLRDCTIRENAGAVGGVHCDGASSPTFESCDISRNWGATAGGVRADAASDSPRVAARFVECSISENHARGDGGGVHLFFTGLEGADAPAFLSCSITGNYAADSGGGVYSRDGSAFFENCAIWGNASRSDGGAVYAWNGRAPSFQSCTIARNDSLAPSGGFFCGAGTSPFILNSIVFSNSPDSACGDIESSITDRDPLFLSPGEFDYTRFAVIEFEGRGELELPDFILAEPDLRLRSNSPAVDLVPLEAAPETDITGAARPCAGNPDAGAYESCPRDFRRSDCNNDGLLDLSDPVSNLNYQFLGVFVPPCLDACDFDDSGEIDVTDPIASLAHQFLGGPAAPAPGIANCGTDPTGDGLDCSSFAPCDIPQ